MNYIINFADIDNAKRNKFNEEIADLNKEKAEQISLLSSFLAANKDVFHSAYMFDFNSISDVSQLNGEFDYWIRSLRDARRNAERTNILNRVLNNFYVKLADIYNRINETNKEFAQYESEIKSSMSSIPVESLREPVEYINKITEIGNRIGEKRNKIAIIINYMKNIDTEDFMKNDHRMMVDSLKNEIDLDMLEICKLLASKNLDVDNYRIFRSNISRNVAYMDGTSLSLNDVSYDVLYHEYNELSEMLRNARKPIDAQQPEEIHEELAPISSEESPIEMPSVDNNHIEDNLENNFSENFDESSPSTADIPVEDASLGDTPEENIDEGFSVDAESSSADNLDTEDEEVEREPVKNSPLSQFRDKFKRSVKGISTASSKLKENINNKVLKKSALRWAGVVGVLAAAAVINPALLLGGAAIGAGVYEYNIAKKMK